jgi:SAM-dependent methyltransferase
MEADTLPEVTRILNAVKTERKWYEISASEADKSHQIACWVISQLLQTLPTASQEIFLNKIAERFLFLKNTLFSDTNRQNRQNEQFETASAREYQKIRNGRSVHLELGTYSAFPIERVELEVGYGLGDFIRLDRSAEFGPEIVANAAALPFCDESLDSVGSNSLFEHVAYPHEIIRECWRVLRPGGVFRVIVPFHLPEHGCPEDHLRYTGQFFETVLRDFGFVNIVSDSVSPSGMYYTLHEMMKAAIPERNPEIDGVAVIGHSAMLTVLGALQVLDDYHFNASKAFHHATLALALKPGEYSAPLLAPDRTKSFLDRYLDRLICPSTGLPVVWQGEKLVSLDGSQTYPVVDGAPHLIAQFGFGSQFHHRPSSREQLAEWHRHSDPERAAKRTIATMQTDRDLRSEIAEKYLRGRGFEVGAGLSPTQCDAIDEIRFIDKRDPGEFARLFGQPPPYPILSLGDAKAAYPKGADFLIAHHVLEHCSNPIKILATEWLPLLRDGGVLFLSMPSSKLISEARRIVTPIDHILDDWAFDRDDDAFESVDHITSFIVGWTDAFPGNFPYSRGTVGEYTTGILSEINRRGHDLHWHTYSLAAATDLTAVAFHAAGAGIEWLERREAERCLYLVARKLAHAPGTPEPKILSRYRKRLLEAHRRLGSGDPAATTAAPPSSDRDVDDSWDGASLSRKDGIRIGDEGYEKVPLGRFIPDSGLAWYADLPFGLVEGDTMEEPGRSPLLLFENGALLGPAHAMHDSIRQQGGGAYSHWKRRVLFSTSDGTNPITNGRRYVAAAPRAAGSEVMLAPGEMIPAFDRSAAVKARIPLSVGHGLEISPGAAPLVRKSEGNITYCDKFAPSPNDNRAQVPIDLVLGPRLIHEAFPPDSFDYIVTSHVIEHVPDFIQLLKSVSVLLRPGGVMVSFLPDRRFTLDVLRENSSFQEIEAAHQQKLRHPCPAMIADAFLKSDFDITEATAIHLWNQTYQPRPYYSPDEALKLIAETNPEEADLHCWTFTPQSCRALLDQVIERHIPDMRIAEITETPRGRNEFLLHLTFGENKKILPQNGAPSVVARWMRNMAARTAVSRARPPAE